MTRHRMLIAVCSSLLLVAACSKKKDDGKPAAVSGPIANTADYESRGTGFIEKMIGILTADEKDCDKLAADLSKFFDDTKSEVDAMKAYEKAHPEDKEQLNKKVEAKSDKFAKVLESVGETCKDNKALEAAMTKMP
jgi:hypothetical protein